MLSASAFAADSPQWGEQFSRNMVSPETGLAARFDPSNGTHVAWSAALGSETYGTPVIAAGRVFIGTNNKVPRDDRRGGDRGILLCLDESDGHLHWQLAVPKRTGDLYLDWPGAGLCSPPTVAGRRVYVVSNRGELLCLDLDGMANGNDGPFVDEAVLLSPEGGAVTAVGPLDADVIWVTDLKKTPGIYTHDSAHASILLDGDLLYLNTGNGVDNTHRRIRSPDAASLVAVDRATGRIVAQDAERIGPRIVHCQWSSPSLGDAGGRRLLVFAGADAVVRAFEPPAGPFAAAGPPAVLRCVWRHDLDPDTVKEAACEWNGRREAGGPSTIHAMPVLVGGRVYTTVGGDRWWGKREARLICLDAADADGDGAVARRWQYPLDRHCMSTPAVSGGLVFVADSGRKMHCVDAASGTAVWTHDLQGEVSGSPLVADGKVYVGTQRGVLYAFAASRERRLVGETSLDGAIWGSPAAANGVLYVASMRRLYAVRHAGGRSGGPAPNQ
ncbi:MAG: PQQ-binding-like beta-propeller repeat protein [Verrucomicrobia bacterium]|nr:PQQ-binding-like beta-propeller repeat protein [Verrucomicrobiota bacterium]